MTELDNIPSLPSTPSAPADELRNLVFVFVVESPSHDDIYHRRSEGDIISKAVALNQIDCEVRMATSREQFYAALEAGLGNATRKFPNKVPILHISAHGNNAGFQMRSGEWISWEELRTFRQC